jgi:hypothetical protein
MTMAFARSSEIVASASSVRRGSVMVMTWLGSLNLRGRPPGPVFATDETNAPGAALYFWFFREMSGIFH